MEKLLISSLNRVSELSNLYSNDAALLAFRHREAAVAEGGGHGDPGNILFQMALKFICHNEFL